MSGIFLHSPVFSYSDCRLIFNKQCISNFELVKHGRYITNLSSEPGLKA